MCVCVFVCAPRVRRLSDTFQKEYTYHFRFTIVNTCIAFEIRCDIRADIRLKHLWDLFVCIFFFCEKYTLRSEGEMFQFGSGYRRSAFFFYSSVLSVESVQLNSNTFIWELLRYCSCWKSRNQIAHYQCCSVAFLMRCCVRMPTSLCIFQFGLSKHQRYALARASL